MALNRIIADSIADGTVVASDIADGTITLAKLQSGLLPPATANSAAAYANAAFATANTGTASGSYANSAFSVANNGVGIDATQNTNITSAGSYANGAFIKANSSVSLTANVTGTLPVGNGGTGAATLTSNNVLLGNGASAVNFVAPGSNGNLLTSNGTTWTSAAPSGGVTSVNGQTGAVTLTNAGDIGSIGIFMNAGNADLAYSSTIAGSTLRFGYATNAGTSSPTSVPFASFRNVGSASYNGGGTSLSGTWRKLNTEKIYIAYAVCCGTNYNYYSALYIRVS